MEINNNNLQPIQPNPNHPPKGRHLKPLMEGMTEEGRKELKPLLQSLSEEQREELKTKLDEFKSEAESLSPEERSAMFLNFLAEVAPEEWQQSGIEIDELM